MTLFGGAPGASILTDTLWLEASPRFLLPNLMHTPIYIVHGVSDTLVPNATKVYTYMQARHVVDTPNYSDARGTAWTLDQLHAQWPGSYLEQHVWPPADHGSTQNHWLPDNILSFFRNYSLVTNPVTIAFTTYEDKHTQAYWLQLNLMQPRTATPGLVYAIRDPVHNSLRLQVTGSLTLTIDMNPAGLIATRPLTIVVTPISGSIPHGDLAIILAGT